jgi:hypothetical protein
VNCTPARRVAHTRTFSGLTSRWTTPAACAAPERVAELREQLVDLGRRHRAAPLEEDREGLALEQLHHEEGRAARTVEARRDDLDDVLALDTRAHPSLLHEPLAELVVAHEVLVHELEDTLATRAQLRDDVDGPHAAGGELVVDLIVGRDDRPGREHGGEEDSPLSRASPTSAWRSRSSSRRGPTFTDTDFFPSSGWMNVTVWVPAETDTLDFGVSPSGCPSSKTRLAGIELMFKKPLPVGCAATGSGFAGSGLGSGVGAFVGCGSVGLTATGAGAALATGSGWAGLVFLETRR